MVPTETVYPVIVEPYTPALPATSILHFVYPCRYTSQPFTVVLLFTFVRVIVPRVGTTLLGIAKDTVMSVYPIVVLPDEVVHRIVIEILEDDVAYDASDTGGVHA